MTTGPPLRGVYWKRVPPSAVAGSIWGGTLDHEEPALTQFDATEVEAAFSCKPSAGGAAIGGSVTPRAGPTYVALLDTKRATNAGIALARLGLPHGGALTRAVLQMDESKLDVTKATSLLTVVPTTEEAELIRGFDGDTSQLGSTERYARLIVQTLSIC